MIIQTAEIFITKMLQPSYKCLLFIDAESQLPVKNRLLNLKGCFFCSQQFNLI